eukprot:g5922.t1
MDSSSGATKTTHQGLAIVIGAGWLNFFQIRRLETTCLYVCRESRRQVGRTVRVEAETPRSLWHGGYGGSAEAARPAAITGSGSRKIHKFSWHRSSSVTGTPPPAAPASTTRTTSSPTTAPTTTTTTTTTITTAPPTPFLPCSPQTGAPSSTRVPRVRCVRMGWLLPVAELLSPGFSWPRGVREIRFGPLFEDGVERIVFPETLETLEFGYRFNRSLGPGRVRWPPGLRRLKLGATWNRLLTGARDSWPASLEVLEFGTCFDKPLQGKDGAGLPRGLREVILGGVFDQPLAGVEWPAGLQELTLSEHFDQPLEFGGGGARGVSFPAGLRRIVFGGQFDQEVSSTAWPQGLVYLSFGDKFNRAFVPPGVDSCYASGGAAGGGSGSGSGGGSRRSPSTESSTSSSPTPSFALPAGLKTLVLGDGYDRPMGEGELPDGLQKLVIGRSFSYVSTVRWPSALKSLRLSCRWGDGGDGGGNGGGGGNRARHWLILPPRLVYLDVGDSFNSPLDRIVFPASLKVLLLGSAFDHPIDHAAPSGALAPAESSPPGLPAGHGHPATPAPAPAAGPASTHALEPQGPQRRRRQQGLSLPEPPHGGPADHRCPPPMLPDGLETLRLGSAFNRDIETARLPRRLKRLVFAADSQFDHPINSVAWPPGLEQLHIGNCFDQRVEAGGGGGGGGGGCGVLGVEAGGGGGGGDVDSALTLPSGLRELSFGCSFSHSLQGLVLPRGLRHLYLAGSYPLSHVRGLEWPPSLRCIEIGGKTLRSREEVFKLGSRPPF